MLLMHIACQTVIVQLFIVVNYNIMYFNFSKIYKNWSYCLKSSHENISIQHLVGIYLYNIIIYYNNVYCNFRKGR